MPIGVVPSNSNKEPVGNYRWVGKNYRSVVATTASVPETTGASSSNTDQWHGRQSHFHRTPTLSVAIEADVRDIDLVLADHVFSLRRTGRRPFPFGAPCHRLCSSPEPNQRSASMSGCGGVVDDGVFDAP